MFDLTDKDEEDKRRNWYSPIGEYVLLFSNLEFELSNWIHLLSDNGSLRNASNKLPVSNRIDVLFELIYTHLVSAETREKWIRDWQEAKELAKTRNLICHNPPIDNFSISLDKKGGVSLDSQVEEIHSLRKPIGEPGSGLSLTRLTNDIKKLRALLIRLDTMHTEEILRGGN